MQNDTESLSPHQLQEWSQEVLGWLQHPQTQAFRAKNKLAMEQFHCLAESLLAADKADRVLATVARAAQARDTEQYFQRLEQQAVDVTKPEQEEED